MKKQTKKPAAAKGKKFGKVQDLMQDMKMMKKAPKSGKMGKW